MLEENKLWLFTWSTHGQRMQLKNPPIREETEGSAANQRAQERNGRRAAWSKLHKHIHMKRRRFLLFTTLPRPQEERLTCFYGRSSDFQFETEHFVRYYVNVKYFHEPAMYRGEKIKIYMSHRLCLITAPGDCLWEK